MGNIRIDNKLEKIYTPDYLTKHLLELLDEWYKEDIVEFLEPTAGSGQMLDYIKTRFQQPVLAYDIFNEIGRTDIVEQDFLKLILPYKKGRVTIMNPPFQKGIKMVYKALEMSDIVISILSLNSFVNFNYEKYDVKVVELINKQTFSDGKKYDICIIVVKNII